MISPIGKKEVSKMKILKSKNSLCLSCMKEHKVDIVKINEKEIYKGVEIEFTAIYEYCSNTDEYLETEEMIKVNTLAIKDAYRKKTGLLTSSEIKNLREKYGISQKDLSEILDWGRATITRYENHQIQDRAHDDILRKIDSDPKWFLEILTRAENKLSAKAFSKYYHAVNKEYRKKKNQYLIDSIYAIYANYEKEITGCRKLDLEKVVEVINYLSENVNNLHMVKLMKMLWYSDMLHFRKYGTSITGLAYRTLPMGAVPDDYKLIVSLEGVSFELVCYDTNIGFKFKPTPGFEINKLSTDEINTINQIIKNFGDLNSKQIIDKMHEEDAYKFTQSNCLIPYSYAKQLSIS